MVALLDAAQRELDPRAPRAPPPRAVAGRARQAPTAPALARHRLAAVTLGPFLLYQDGAPVEAWHGSRGPRIARYLIAHRGHPVPRERLMELLWPETDPEVGRRNLHQAVYSLRRTLRRRQPGMQHIVFENDCYRLNPELDVWCDADEFEARVQEGCRLGGQRRTAEAAAALAEGAALYRGDYLEDTPFEEWTISQRDYLAALYEDAVRRLAAIHLEHGRPDDAIACARRLLVRQAADEAAHQLIIRAQLTAGRRGEALRQYRCCAEALCREYGLGPSSQTSALCGDAGAVGEESRPGPVRRPPSSDAT